MSQRFAATLRAATRKQTGWREIDIEERQS
jgi:hypothetical protein